MRIIVGLFVAFLGLPAGLLPAAMTVSLEPSVPPPSYVGDSVVWRAGVSDPAPGRLWYRFRVRPARGEFRTVIDYGPESSFLWTPVDREGRYEVEVSARNRDTGEVASAFSSFLVLTWPNLPVVRPTIHAMVFIYSAAGCPEGGQMRVEFGSARGDLIATPAKPCTPGATMNFLLAGMVSSTEYTARHVLETTTGTVTGPPIAITTPPRNDYFKPSQVTTPAPPQSSHPVLLQSTTSGGKASASDLEGNVLWYYPGNINSLTRPVAGGTFVGIAQQASPDGSASAVRQFDLTGTTLRETNAARVNEQLAAMGRHPVSGFHHEAGILPGDRLLVLGSTERLLTDVQGPGQVDVVGDAIIVLGPDLQVEWAWDAFDHIDPAGPAVLGESCSPLGGGGCPTYYLAASANDWLHSNSVQLTPDGNLVMSIRHLDMVIKIDYNNGRGSGAILWRLGRDRDFRIVSSDPNPWFSHQHDATILPGPDVLLTLFDNGNTRAASDPSTHSRGQMYRLDEANRVATLVYSADLGDYSSALGSARRLPNGNFHFDLGTLGGGIRSRTVETDAEGRIVFDIDIPYAAYRTFRMQSLYAP